MQWKSLQVTTSFSCINYYLFVKNENPYNNSKNESNNVSGDFFLKFNVKGQRPLACNGSRSRFCFEEKYYGNNYLDFLFQTQIF